MIEADMQREYALDLRVDLPSMTWRRFRVLIRGLSPNSATATKLSSGRYMGARGEKVELMQTPEAAEQRFAQLFGPPKQTQPD